MADTIIPNNVPKKFPAISFMTHTGGRAAVIEAYFMDDEIHTIQMLKAQKFLSTT